MNGARAELAAKAMRIPKSTRIRISGVSHHHLFLKKNVSSSPIMPNRLARLVSTRIHAPPFLKLLIKRRLFDEAVPEYQHVHTAPRKRTERLLRCIHNRLSFQVERRV